MIKIGDKVTWLCKVYYSGDVFIATGTVVKLGVSTFGATKKGMAVTVSVEGKYCTVFPNRGKTTISMSNIKTINGKEST